MQKVVLVSFVKYTGRIILSKIFYEIEGLPSWNSECIWLPWGTLFVLVFSVVWGEKMGTIK